MKIFKNVKSTAENIPYIEVNVDTVYVRTNITDIKDDEGNPMKNIGQEIQYNKDHYIEGIGEAKDLLENALMEMTMNQAIKDAENETAIMELTMTIGGMI